MKEKIVQTNHIEYIKELSRFDNSELVSELESTNILKKYCKCLLGKYCFPL